MSVTASGTERTDGVKPAALQHATTDFICANVNIGFIATLINGAILFWVLRNEVSTLALSAWATAVASITLMRYLHVGSYRRASVTAEDAPQWQLWLDVGMLASGVLWGLTSLLLFPSNSTPHQVFLAFVVGGMVAGAAGTYSVSMRTFLFYSIPALLPLIVRFFLVSDEIHMAMGMMLLLFSALMIGVASRTGQTTTTALRLRLEKTSLIDYLRAAKERAENLNRELEIEIEVRTEAERALEQHQEGLKRLVEERTADLTDTNAKLKEQIGERRKAEEALVRADKLESLGHLAGGVAHDFNNLLTGILYNLSLALKRAEDRETVVRRLGAAERVVLRARGLTQQLLSLSKDGAPIKKPVAINTLLREWVDFALMGAKVTCDLRVDEGLWPTAVDEGQINQVVNNLVINAVQAMPNGGTLSVRAVNVEIEEHHSLSPGQYVRVTIQDEGPGISEEVRAKLFEPFFTTKPYGTGLGLSTSLSIVDHHGGCIDLEPSSTRGAVFHIHLPACDELPETPEAFEPAESVGCGRILLMDDEPFIREGTGELLRDAGFDVVCAQDGREAVELYIRAQRDACPFDAVILDLTVPGGMGGEATVTELLARDPEVRAIASSGYSNDPVVAAFEDRGFKGVVVKPCPPNELIQTISKIVVT